MTEFRGQLTTCNRKMQGVVFIDPPPSWIRRVLWRVQDGVVWVLMFALLAGAFALNPEAASRGFLTGFVVGTVAGR